MRSVFEYFTAYGDNPKQMIFHTEVNVNQTDYLLPFENLYWQYYGASRAIDYASRGAFRWEKLQKFVEDGVAACDALLAASLSSQFSTKFTRVMAKPRRVGDNRFWITYDKKFLTFASKRNDGYINRVKMYTLFCLATEEALKAIVDGA